MKRTVLIVDDQPDIRQLAHMTMELGDFELHEADNGLDALWMAYELHPTIVLLDVMMPGPLDGYQVCEQIKSDRALQQDTAVILVTACGQRSDIERGRQAGCDAYLVKPFSPRELLATVERLVSAREARP